MDKDLDYEIHNEFALYLPHLYDLYQKKVLHTRILKFSAEKSKESSVEIGRISLESGQFQKAFVQLKRATIIDPDSLYAQVFFADALLKLEKENEAFSILQKVLSLDPNYSDPHYIIIRRFKELKRLGDLGSFYQEIAKRLTDPRSIAALYSESARSLVSSDEYSKAFEMYEKAIEANPMDSGSHYDYALALYGEGLFEESRVQFEHVKKLEPTNRIAFNNTAHLQYCLGRLEKALEELEYIIENGLESPGTYSNLILVLYHLDKDEEVINQYRDLLQQNLRGNGPILQAMYQRALEITQMILERDDIDEETREFNTKKIQGLNLVHSFIN